MVYFVSLTFQIVQWLLIILAENYSPNAARYINIPLMSDQKCSKKMSKATRRDRMCTSARDAKLICDVSIIIYQQKINIPFHLIKF